MFNKGEVFMTRLRVHELAKELNMNNKDLLDRLVKLGFQVKNHMSTLTDAAVLKIRQQYAEAKAERVEEKRIGRAVIRRRKRADEEGSPAGAEEFTDIPSTAEEVDVPVSETFAEELTETMKAPLAAPEPPKVPEVEPEPDIIPETVSVQEKSEPAQPQVTAPLAKTEAPPEKMEVTPAEPPVVTAPRASEVLPEPEPPQPEPPPAQEEVILEKSFEPDVMSRQAAALVEPVEPAELPAETAEDSEAKTQEDDDSKPRKAKKRRRKKARKEEPARIIKLPDIIPEEPEEEVAIPQHLATKIQVKPEDLEVKEGPRKRRVRTAEEFEKEAAERKRRAAGGGARKEVVGREELYSKKELAAQDDRGRHRGGQRPADAEGNPQGGARRSQAGETPRQSG